MPNLHKNSSVMHKSNNYCFQYRIDFSRVQETQRTICGKACLLHFILDFVDE